MAHPLFCGSCGDPAVGEDHPLAGIDLCAKCLETMTKYGELNHVVIARYAAPEIARLEKYLKFAAMYPEKEDR